MNKFILIIIINFQLVDDPKNIEFRLTQNSYNECIDKANEIKKGMNFLKNLITFNAKCIPYNKDVDIIENIKEI